jgi:hypothetical protein
VDDRVRVGQALGRLAEISQVGDEELRLRFRRTHEVDAQHLMTVLDQVERNGSSGFAACAGDDDLHGAGDYF